MKRFVKANDDMDINLIGYGIDYRDMHTALHSIIWTPDESIADRIDVICSEMEASGTASDVYDMYVDEIESYLASNEAFIEEEINFRNITNDNKYYVNDEYIQILNNVAYDLYL